MYRFHVDNLRVLRPESLHQITLGRSVTKNWHWSLKMSQRDLILVAGAGGFIGGHLVRALREEGFENIRAVDQKPISGWLQVFEDVQSHTLDLKRLDACRIATRDAV